MAHRILALFVPADPGADVALGFHLGYPELKGFNFKAASICGNSLIALWLALSLYTAAFIAEIVRAGYPWPSAKGQTEAASALGCVRAGRCAW